MFRDDSQFFKTEQLKDYLDDKKVLTYYEKIGVFLKHLHKRRHKKYIEGEISFIEMKS